MAKYTLKDNQYIPRNAKSLPSGLPKASTYYYIVNEKGQTLDKKTLKPYKGKQLDRISMLSKAAAEAYVESINKNCE